MSGETPAGNIKRLLDGQLGTKKKQTTIKKTIDGEKKLAKEISYWKKQGYSTKVATKIAKDQVK